MKYGCQSIRIKRVQTTADVWINLTYQSTKGVKIDGNILREYRPTLWNWICWCVSWLAGTRSMKMQFYDLGEACRGHTAETATVSSMLHWKWASAGTLRQLVHCVGVVQAGETLIAHGTMQYVRAGVDGFSLLPCIIGTAKGTELRFVASFQLPAMLKQGGVWFLEIPPS